MYVMAALLQLGIHPNLPKFRVYDVIPEERLSFRQRDPFFWTQRSFLHKNATIYLTDIDSLENCNTLFRWCFKENDHSFSTSIRQWRHIPWENFKSFLRAPKNGDLWQAITSSKINIFWCGFFCSFRFLKGIRHRE